MFLNKKLFKRVLNRLSMTIHKQIFEKKLKKYIDKKTKILYPKFRIILKKESYDETKKTGIRCLKRSL